MESGPANQTLSSAMQIALAHHKAGRLPDAEKICREVLQTDPHNADALGMLGRIALHAGKNGPAADLLLQATRLQPSNPFFPNELGLAYCGLGMWDLAERSCRQSLARKPDYAEAHYNLGIVLGRLGRLGEAERSYRQALALNPGFVEARGNLGTALASLGRPEEAVLSFRKALALRPGLALVHNNLGISLATLGRLEEAERSYREALAHKPDYAEAHNNLGNLLAGSGRLEEAERSYRQALTLKPDLAEAHYHLGIALISLGRLKEAEQSYRQALAHKPDYPDAYYDLGNVTGSLGRTEEAERNYRQALALRPDYPEALGQWVHKCQWLCAWSGLARHFAAMHQHAALGKPGQLQPFCFLSLPDADAGGQHACARQFAERAYQSLISRPALHGAGLRSDSARLRIGYVSGDIRTHATSYLLAEIIECHDRRRVEVFGYSYGPDDKSQLRIRMQNAFDTFRDIQHDPNESAARRIAADGIDILVDLKGYTAGARMEIAALRPAPVQVSWLGYPGTLGHRRLADYLIGDPIVTPLEHAGHFSESLALMPHCYQPNDRQRAVGERPARAQAGLAETGFVFCCFCQPYKITPAMFDLWCRLLREVPGSLLWLLQSTPTAQNNLRREAAARGIAADRIVFAPLLPLGGHLGRLQLADLVLDTYPVTSHTTASDALWAGVPLVTMMGDSFVSRVAASILHAAGLPELVARDADSYHRLALELATQPERIRFFRTRLAANRMTCPLFDSERFARDLERLYQRMAADHRAGRKEHIVL